MDSQKLLINSLIVHFSYNRITVTKKWQLKYFPNGNTNGANEYLSLFLHFVESKDCENNSWADARFTIVNSDESRSMRFAFMVNNELSLISKHGHGYSKCFERTIILNPKNAFL